MNCMNTRLAATLPDGQFLTEMHIHSGMPRHQFQLHMLTHTDERPADARVSAPCVENADGTTTTRDFDNRGMVTTMHQDDLTSIRPSADSCGCLSRPAARPAAACLHPAAGLSWRQYPLASAP